tara:strand:- start:144 stop:326 length:183 start_codon:yes stop_codon:yes gene_type:complete
MTKQIIEVRNHTTFTVTKVERVVKNIKEEEYTQTQGEVKYNGFTETVYVDSYGEWYLDTH